MAERAAPLIEEAYRYLVDSFDYVPTETFPYVLYSSYQEFLQTNVFPISEGTLGVTSREDLKLTLPYLGDHRLFREVGTHELTHEFTIQKVRTVTKGVKGFGDPMTGMPLWFIEGLAEFYTHRGLDPETEMLVRDVLVNPDVLRGYAYIDFDGADLASNGGDILMYGRSDPANGAASSFATGVHLGNSTIATGGGNLLLRGESTDQQIAAP